MTDTQIIATVLPLRWFSNKHLTFYTNMVGDFILFFFCVCVLASSKSAWRNESPCFYVFKNLKLSLFIICVYADFFGMPWYIWTSQVLCYEAGFIYNHEWDILFACPSCFKAHGVGVGFVCLVFHGILFGFPQLDELPVYHQYQHLP